MNLVLSGPIESALLTLIEQLSQPLSVTPVSQRTWRFETVDDASAIRNEVANRCADAAVDHAYVEPNLKFSDMKLLALDMDSTLITIECIDELADFAGRKKEVAAITEATMQGEISEFAESLRRRVAILRGLDADVLRRVYDERLSLSPGAETLISAARANGIYVLLVSGGFTYFADRLRNLLHIDAAFANQLETSGGKLTGRVVGDIIDANAKAFQVTHAMRLIGCSGAEAIVIGDGANDIPMMRCVEYSVAYRAKPTVQKNARLAVTYGTLETILAYF